MKEFTNKVAVITGAASGIGRGLAERCVQEGMKVVLADIEETALSQTERALREASGNVLAVRTDVSKEDDVEALAKKTLSTFGAVHLLFNNAGVGAGTSAWDSTLADWQWVIGVNLWGIIYGIRTFIPIMLAQDVECHVVNTASVAGLLPFHPIAAYQTTKHAVVGLSENVYYYLSQKKAKVKISVLCPGWVKTNIMQAERNRPAELQNKAEEMPITPEYLAVIQSFIQSVESGMSPTQVADIVFKAIEEGKFYILTDHQYDASIQMRMESILQGRNLVL